MDTSDLGKRMKDYERRNRYYLQRRMPVIVRVDMNAGHTFLKDFARPFDEVFIKSMQETAKYLCENIPNCKLSYQQSDEISLLLIDYENLNTSSFFDYRVDKLCSIVASMATLAFNKILLKNINSEVHIFDDEWLDDDNFNPNYKNKELIDLYIIHKRQQNKGAIFDARCLIFQKKKLLIIFTGDN